MGEHAIEIFHEPPQLILQIGQAREVAATNHLPHDNAEHNLNLIQPRAMLRRIYKAYAMCNVFQKYAARFYRLQNATLTFFAQRCFQFAQLGNALDQSRRAMRVQVIDDDFPIRRGIARHCLLNVCDEIHFGSRGAKRAAKHFTTHHIEVSYQGRRAMANVFKLMLGDAAASHRLIGRGPLQGLNSGHFVDANGSRAVLCMTFVSLLIGLANLPHLSLEHCRIFLGGVEPHLFF